MLTFVLEGRGLIEVGKVFVFFLRFVNLDPTQDDIHVVVFQISRVQLPLSHSLWLILGQWDLIFLAGSLRDLIIKACISIAQIFLFIISDLVLIDRAR